MSKNKKQTTPNVASQAASVLNNPKSSDIAKSLAGSALAQHGTTKQTGADVERTASKALSSPKYSEQTKTLAGSVLSQSNRARGNGGKKK
jgi:hypothetical protein